MMRKNILVLVGSPRKDGNTDVLSNAFIEGTLEAGHKVEKITLQNHNINGCFGCDYCIRNRGECVQKDDMQMIYDKLNKADAVVLATPLYFFGFSSQIKKVIDRFYALLSGSLSNKESILLTAYGSQNSHEIDVLIAQYKMIASALNWRNLGVISAKGVLKKGDISNHPSISEAKKLGANMI